MKNDFCTPGGGARAGALRVQRRRARAIACPCCPVNAPPARAPPHARWRVSMVSHASMFLMGKKNQPILKNGTFARGQGAAAEPGGLRGAPGVAHEGPHPCIRAAAPSGARAGVRRCVMACARAFLRPLLAAAPHRSRPRAAQTRAAIWRAWGNHCLGTGRPTHPPGRSGLEHGPAQLPLLVLETLFYHSALTSAL